MFAAGCSNGSAVSEPAVIDFNVTDKTGYLVGIMSVNDDNDLVIINKSGITLRFHVTDIRVMGRATQGVRLINLEKRDDEIASVCCVDTDPEEDVEAIEINGEELTEEIVDIEEPDVEEPEVDDEEIEEDSSSDE